MTVKFERRIDQTGGRIIESQRYRDSGGDQERMPREKEKGPDKSIETESIQEEQAEDIVLKSLKRKYKKRVIRMYTDACMYMIIH